ncbi:hypothetical protein Bca52824_010215 [Brassica carinata]|uniref:Protein kinase domain-containing protein n=1 Tax=Brassica carinata TaxID=52824 RepID=A0A8X8BAH8_BRACI|nr:hypothetical protein Bca52824_010215 [Brassica carinata]
MFIQGHKEWINEVSFLGVVNHPNLVKLVGYCADDDERGMQRLLVYELMCNKSLEDHLVGRVMSVSLPWITRLKIAQDAAQGLAYLHEQMDFQRVAALANKCIMKQPKSRPRMSEVVSLLGSIIDEETENTPTPLGDETEEITKAEVSGESEPEVTKQRSHYLKKVLVLKDKMSLNKSLSKLDWRNWTPGLVRTW